MVCQLFDFSMIPFGRIDPAHLCFLVCFLPGAVVTLGQGVGTDRRWQVIATKVFVDLPLEVGLNGSLVNAARFAIAEDGKETPHH